MKLKERFNSQYYNTCDTSKSFLCVLLNIFINSIVDGWKMLIHSVYNDTNNVWNGQVVGRVPLIRPKVTNKLMVRMWYDPKVLFLAWKMMIESIEDKDIIDTFR